MNPNIRNMLFPLLALSCAAPPAWAEDAAPRRFASPDEAAAALAQAAQAGDHAALAGLFGAGHEGLLSSGDPVEDKNNLEGFAAMAKEKTVVEKTGEAQATVRVGNNGWPFPVPLAKQGEGWQFDAAQGEQEIINRRIGRNEMRTLSAVRGYVEAQADYASQDRDGDGVPEYAQKLSSAPGQRDGLFWEAAVGEPESPLGPLMADARAQGYELKGDPRQPTPYHGYYFRILTRQGPAAPGGQYDYVINGNMIAGFALVAFPASYGVSGVMSFIVNHQGRIYQQDLGPKTAEIARAMKAFNPDKGWEPVVLSD
jgi:hypothetical protein